MKNTKEPRTSVSLTSADEQGTERSTISAKSVELLNPSPSASSPMPPSHSSLNTSPQVTLAEFLKRAAEEDLSKLLLETNKSLKRETTGSLDSSSFDETGNENAHPQESSARAARHSDDTSRT